VDRRGRRHRPLADHGQIDDEIRDEATATLTDDCP
jgi:hypothetical protein